MFPGASLNKNQWDEFESDREKVQDVDDWTAIDSHFLLASRHSGSITGENYAPH